MLNVCVVWPFGHPRFLFFVIMPFLLHGGRRYILKLLSDSSSVRFSSECNDTERQSCKTIIPEQIE